MLTILAIAGATAALGSLVFGALHQRKAANTLKDIHETLKQVK